MLIVYQNSAVYARMIDEHRKNNLLWINHIFRNIWNLVEITKIYLCLDSDEAGRNASNALKIVMSDKYEIIDKPPKKRQRL